MSRGIFKSLGVQVLGSAGFEARVAKEEREFNAACPWKVNEETEVLYLPEGGDHPYYEFRLEKFTSSAEVLDSISQVAEKTWMDDATLGALVRKFDQLFELRGTFCGGGRDETINPIEHLRKTGRLM